MPLDPTIQPIVDLVNAAAAEAPPIEDQTVAERREAYHGLVAAAGVGPELASVADADADGVPVRIYRDGDTRGVLVFYHGGGWVIGDLDTHDEVCRQLAKQSGATVVAVDYRLGPEAVFPAAVDDSWTALQWVAAQRESLTGDPDAKVAVSGDSAGGNLSAVMALMARDAGLPLAAQLLVYPATDMRMTESKSLDENGEGYVLTKDTMLWFRANYIAAGAAELEDEKLSDWRASPSLADSHAGLAPALVITAEFDPLRDEGAAYAETLRNAGVEVTHTNYDGMVHIFFQLGPIVPKGAEAVAQVAAAAKAALA